LNDIVVKAQITGHQQVALSSIGGSQIIQHWNVPDDKNQIKPALIGSKADVLTLSPIYLPDAGIENFVRLGLEQGRHGSRIVPIPLPRNLELDGSLSFSDGGQARRQKPSEYRSPAISFRSGSRIFSNRSWRRSDCTKS